MNTVLMYTYNKIKTIHKFHLIFNTLRVSGNDIVLRVVQPDCGFKAATLNAQKEGSLMSALSDMIAR